MQALSYIQYDFDRRRTSLSNSIDYIMQAFLSIDISWKERHAVRPTGCQSAKKRALRPTYEKNQGKADTPYALWGVHLGLTKGIRLLRAVISGRKLSPLFSEIGLEHLAALILKHTADHLGLMVKGHLGKIDQ